MSDFTKAICGDWLNGKTVILQAHQAVWAQESQLHLLKNTTAV